MTGFSLVDYPKPWFLFWSAVVLAHGYMDYTLCRKWRTWKRGMKEPGVPRGRWGRTGRIWLAEVFLQRQLFGLSSFRWLIHLLIFFGFLGLAFLSLSTVLPRPLAHRGLDGGLTQHFLQGEGYIFIKIWGDSFGLALLVGLVIACVRRFLFRSAQQNNNQTDVLLLVFLLWLSLSGFLLEVLRLSLVPAEIARYSFVERLFIPSGSYTPEVLKPWLTLLWIFHSFSGLALLVYLPHSKLLHSILSPLVIAMNARVEQERKDIYWPDIAKHKATR